MYPMDFKKLVFATKVPTAFFLVLLPYRIQIPPPNTYQQYTYNNSTKAPPPFSPTI